MERENVDFYTKSAEGYLVLAKGMPERFNRRRRHEEADAIEKKILV